MRSRKFPPAPFDVASPAEGGTGMTTASTITAPVRTTFSASTLAAVVAFAAITPLVLLVAPAVAAQLGMQLGLSASQIGTYFFVELGALSAATLPSYAVHDKCRHQRQSRARLWALGRRPTHRRRSRPLPLAASLHGFRPAVPLCCARRAWRDFNTADPWLR